MGLDLVPLALLIQNLKFPPTLDPEKLCLQKLCY